MLIPDHIGSNRHGTSMQCEQAACTRHAPDMVTASDRKGQIHPPAGSPHAGRASAGWCCLHLCPWPYSCRATVNGTTHTANAACLSVLCMMVPARALDACQAAAVFLCSALVSQLPATGRQLWDLQCAAFRVVPATCRPCMWGMGWE